MNILFESNITEKRIEQSKHNIIYSRMMGNASEKEMISNAFNSFSRSS